MRRKVLIAFLALCVVWIVGVVVWVAVRLLTPPPPDPWEDEERKAGMHHEQHHESERYYIPDSYRTEKDGSVVLRYKLLGSIDSGVGDFRRTYDLDDRPKKTGPTEETYTDRVGGMRRTITFVYPSSFDPDDVDEAAARVTVRAVPE
ncbi:hypothetical protein [Streptomyces boluensis]|uniref:Uncharacterized protein n=1 Tax=Streptomyces boluensis TaxID=1775135 RepID=A0A964XMP1_9ACTN|nr:hypothetical protein [Streptomyces boluensis]NBE54744.1 hypothetical protein [Streptomyces boluensis]